MSFSPIDCRLPGGKQFTLSQSPTDAPLPWDASEGAELVFPGVAAIFKVNIGDALCPMLSTAGLVNGLNQATLTVPNFSLALQIKVLVRANGIPQPITINVG